jgi:hypothetical protein
MESKQMEWNNNFSLNELNDDILVTLFRDLNPGRNDDREIMKLIVLTLYNRKKLHLLNAA